MRIRMKDYFVRLYQYRQHIAENRASYYPDTDKTRQQALINACQIDENTRRAQQTKLKQFEF